MCSCIHKDRYILPMHICDDTLTCILKTCIFCLLCIRNTVFSEASDLPNQSHASQSHSPLSAITLFFVLCSYI